MFAPRPGASGLQRSITSIVDTRADSAETRPWRGFLESPQPIELMLRSLRLSIATNTTGIMTMAQPENGSILTVEEALLQAEQAVTRLQAIAQEMRENGDGDGEIDHDGEMDSDVLIYPADCLQPVHTNAPLNDSEDAPPPYVRQTGPPPAHQPRISSRPQTLTSGRLPNGAMMSSGWNMPRISSTAMPLPLASQAPLQPQRDHPPLPVTMLPMASFPSAQFCS